VELVGGWVVELERDLLGVLGGGGVGLGVRVGMGTGFVEILVD
jgi:hypothetical protein